MAQGKTIIREPGTHVVDSVVIEQPVTEDNQAATKEYVDDHAGDASFATISGTPSENAPLAADLGAKLEKSANLADVADPIAAAANLGALSAPNNLSDVDDPVEAATNLGKDNSLAGANPTSASDDVFPSQKAVRDFLNGAYVGLSYPLGAMYGSVSGQSSNNIINDFPIDAANPIEFGDFLEQPDCPRRIEMHGVSSPVTLHGTDILGNNIEETVSMDGDTERAFAQITQITTDQVVPFNLTIGQSETLGINQALGQKPIYGVHYTSGSYFELNNWEQMQPNAEVSKNVYHEEGYPTAPDYEYFFATGKIFPSGKLA